jgi:hypothetical protein
MLKKLQAILFFIIGLHVLSSCGSSGESAPPPESAAPAATPTQGLDSTEATSSQDSGAPVSWMINFVPGLWM